MAGGQHLNDSQPLLDASYGEMWLELQPYQPEAPCNNRNCQDYSPSQAWYWSPRSGTVRLAAAPGNGYHCDEPGCYQLTTHLPAYDELCLARVASISSYGVDPSSDTTPGTDVRPNKPRSTCFHCHSDLTHSNSISCGGLTIEKS